MIVSTDLRIGNLVKRKSGNYTPVLAIYSDSIHVECEPPLKSLKGMTIPLSTVSGIELTPEILVKCGFVIDDDEGDKIWYKYPHHINNYHVQNDHECWVFAIVHSDGSYTDLIYDKDHFQHLHHLQNIFHSLTGEELTFLIDPLINK